MVLFVLISPVDPGIIRAGLKKPHCQVHSGSMLDRPIV
jgi:hypothetical protein